MKILITGGAGFIGSHLVASLEKEAEVWVFDDLSSGHLKNLEGRNVRFLEGSILNPAPLVSELKTVDWVFHLAAMTSVAESMEQPIQCVEV
jgi:UDP-glucose 4-epimerase